MSKLSGGSVHRVQMQRVEIFDQFTELSIVFVSELVEISGMVIDLDIAVVSFLSFNNKYTRSN